MKSADRQLAFQREHIARLNNKIEVLELRNQRLRDELERATHGEALPPWTPFEEASGAIFADGRTIDRGQATGLMFVNSRYQVSIYRPNDGDFFHLSIKRLDGCAVRDWRDFQRIKNELIGPEHEGVELFPAESRLVDGANQYHLSVFVDPENRFPLGFGQRLVSDQSTDGVQQRPWADDQRPHDLTYITAADMARVAKLDAEPEPASS